MVRFDKEYWDRGVDNMLFLVKRAMNNFREDPNMGTVGYELECGDKTIQVVISEKSKRDLSELFKPYLETKVKQWD